MRLGLAAALTLLVLVPRAVSAQQTNGVIAGQVRDATVGVLRGVTVEVASPAPLERVRTLVPGLDGEYRLVQPRAGGATRQVPVEACRAWGRAAV